MERKEHFSSLERQKFIFTSHHQHSAPQEMSIKQLVLLILTLAQTFLIKVEGIERLMEI
jgi:hypothetical protein